MRTRLLWLISALMFVGVVFGLTPASVHACRCSSGFPEAAVQNADMIFSGRVQRVDEGQVDFFAPRDPVALLEVIANWKGVSESHVLISAPIGCCGHRYDFRVGETYLVFANKTGKASGVAPFMNGTSTMDFDDLYLSILGKSQPPTQVIDPRKLQLHQTPIFLVFLIIATCLFILGMLLFKQGRHRGRL